MLMNIWLLIKLPYNLFRLACYFILNGTQQLKEANELACKRMEERAERERQDKE